MTILTCAIFCDAEVLVGASKVPVPYTTHPDFKSKINHLRQPIHVYLANFRHHSIIILLLGGDNVPINETSFEGVTPKKKSISTPNVVLGTPFRTPNQAMGSTPGRILTPQIGGDKSVLGSTTPSQTPLRDQLSINSEGAVESFSDSGSIKQQVELRAHLRMSLGNLPAPRNDFEIVLPENDEIVEGDTAVIGEYFTEDAAEVEERNNKIRKAEGNGL